MSFELPVGAISSLSGTLSTTDPVEKDWSHVRLLFRPGELMLIRTGPIPKGALPCRWPLKVEKVLGHCTFMLSDGQCWSTHCMKQWYELLLTTYLEPVAIEPEEPQMLRRSPRVNIGIFPICYKP